MNIRNVIFPFALSVTLLAGCSPGPDDAAGETSGGGQSALTENQRELAGVRTSGLEYRLISSTISCTGEIEVPPHGMASVTAPLGGYIVHADIVPGTYVKKGAVLAKLSNPEYVVLQQSYMETAGQIKFAEQDYKRQRSLVEQNAAALKKLQESEASYNVLKARLAGLKERLRMIGVSIAELEKGKIQPEIVLRAPLTGYVTEVNYHQGEFVEPRQAIFRIVDLTDLHLHLNVFERDISGVRPGQTIRFRPAGETVETFRGEVSLVSPQRNMEIRTFDVHGHIDLESERLKPGMYVEAEILVSNDSAFALPQKALVKHGREVFVMIEESGNYKIVTVDTGASMDGWIEIRNNEALRDKRVVTEGASRLFAALRR